MTCIDSCLIYSLADMGWVNIIHLLILTLVKFKLDGADMDARTVIYKGMKAFVVTDRDYGKHGRKIGIQFLSKKGEPLSVQDRPNGFKTRFFVDPEEITECTG
jgi:hypothetical protein